MCSELYPTEVIVSLANDGLVSVVLPGFQRPYMSLQDRRPSHSAYVGFASWENAAARWFYDCPFDNDDSQSNTVEVKQL